MDHVNGCSILDCDGVGLLLKNCTFCRVSNCNVRSERSEDANFEPISVEGGSKNHVEHNLMLTLD